MRILNTVRLAAAAVTFGGGVLLLGPKPAFAGNLDACTDDDFEQAIDAVNDLCADAGAITARIYSCEYHPDSGYIVFEYSCGYAT